MPVAVRIRVNPARGQVGTRLAVNLIAANRLGWRTPINAVSRRIPLDRNAKARIKVYVQGYNTRHRQPGQHHGPITRAYMDVFEALLWGFHNSQDGRCYPSYEAIADKAKCCRDTVYEAIKALEACHG